MQGSGLSDLEAIVRHEPAGSKLELRLWLRLLSSTNTITAEIRRRLRAEFNVTLPRFDVMAQLSREPDGLRLGELSRRMMVTNGNITGLIDRMLDEGLVMREADPTDRRAATVRLTAAGAASFRTMARAHERWIREIFGKCPPAIRARLLDDLGALKSAATSARRRSRGD